MRFCSAHGQRHFNRGDRRLPIFGFFKVIAESGINPVTIIVRLIDRHGIAVNVGHSVPRRRHGFVSGKRQIYVCRSVRLEGVRISNCLGERLAVNGSKCFFRLAVTIKISFFFRHQERSHVVLPCRHQITLFRNRDRNACGIPHRLLVYQIVRAALFIGKIGAKHILCTCFGIFDFAGQVFVQSQVQLFKRCNGKILGFFFHKHK